jgi:hypothetical protein
VPQPTTLPLAQVAGTGVIIPRIKLVSILPFLAEKENIINKRVGKGKANAVTGRGGP